MNAWKIRDENGELVSALGAYLDVLHRIDDRFEDVRAIVLEENEYDNEPPLALFVVRDYGRAEFPAEHLPGFDRDRAGKGFFNHFAGKEQAIWGLWTATNALDWVFVIRDQRRRTGHGPGIDPRLNEGN